MWFDRNSDGLPSSGEWPLPGVAVTLVPVTSTGTGQASIREAAPLRWPTATPALDRSGTTDAEGRYTFEHVAPGAYRVVASASLPGFAYTSDTDGGILWTVSVSVDAGATSVARFAGLGKGTLGGTVYLADNGVAVPNGDVQCVWAGYDDTLGTGDDVVVHAVADAHGAFLVRHVPYGVFSCTGVDPTTSRHSGAVQVTVHSAQLVRASLPVPDGARAHHPTSDTGVPFGQLLAIGIGLLLVGGVAIGLGRRRPARH